MSAPAELAQRFEMVRQINTLAAERDRAIRERDGVQLQNKALRALLRVVTAERDEARALGRSA